MKTYEQTIDIISKEVFELYKTNTLSYDIKTKLQMIALIFDKPYHVVYTDIESIFNSI